MQASSIIEYIDDHTVIVKEGGFISNDISEYVSQKGMYDEPVKGMLVRYATDGYILEIINPNKPDRQTMKEQAPVYYSDDEIPPPSDNGSVYKCEGQVKVKDSKYGNGSVNTGTGTLSLNMNYDSPPFGTRVNVYIVKESGKLLYDFVVMMEKTDSEKLTDSVISINKSTVDFWEHLWGFQFNLDDVVNCVYSK
jgi:hypothetical protein